MGMLPSSIDPDATSRQRVIRNLGSLQLATPCRLNTAHEFERPGTKSMVWLCLQPSDERWQRATVDA
jgi:hypothetical protein